MNPLPQPVFATHPDCGKADLTTEDSPAVGARLVRARPDARPSRFPPRRPASTKPRQRSGGAPADDSESRCGGGPTTHGPGVPVSGPGLGKSPETGRLVGGDGTDVGTRGADDRAGRTQPLTRGRRGGGDRRAVAPAAIPT